jgi:hypothetical protein
VSVRIIILVMETTTYFFVALIFCTKRRRRLKNILIYTCQVRTAGRLCRPGMHLPAHGAPPEEDRIDSGAGVIATALKKASYARTDPARFQATVGGQ